MSLLEEKSVLVLLDSIAIMKHTHSNQGGKAFKPLKDLCAMLNSFVIKMAEQQPDLVNVKFLIHYLARLQQFVSNKDLRVAKAQINSII